jgi:2-polyprenyl-3-methyl-5-hydroxy-6-metoxy-1,4-benzoquinol methylase
MATVMRCLALPGFDIIQCLGLLYHVQNPMLALHQIRRCLAKDGVMLLETACHIGDGYDGHSPVMVLNRDPLIYDDCGSYWFPTEECLQQMLTMTGFTMGKSILRYGQSPKPVKRICVECYAAPIPDLSEDNLGT